MAVHFAAANQLLDALEELALLLRTHLAIARDDADEQDQLFLVARLRVLRRILAVSNQRLLQVNDILDEANHIGRTKEV